MKISVNTRRDELQAELDRIVPILIDDYGAQKIIAFGSFVQGVKNPWADLDIAIVKKTNRRFLDRTLDVSRLVKSTIATDFVVYTPEEIAEMQRNNHFVRDEILSGGEVLYDQTQSG